MDVGAWLRNLGFERYEAAFRANGIDAAVLPHLTVEDLKEIGVATVGDRRKLMAAIAILPRAAGEGDHARHGGGESPLSRPGEGPGVRAPEPLSRAAGPSSPTLLPEGEGGAPSTALRAVPLPRFTGEERAERRPITVMFCDLVGSTELAARLDPEDWRNLVNAYLDEASAVVGALGGHVLKRLGDGLMALFGYPKAQENDAERAARAALAIQRALAGINARNAGRGAPELAARIGLESGPVVVDASGEVFGEAPNVAARVQALAEPGTVLVTANVQRQVAGLFVAEEQGEHALKGLPRPIALYRIVRASGGGRRGRARALSPLVGRAEELGLLMRRWERARSGHGQFVQIVGEPGIGKSRLVEEFHGRLGETPHTWVEFSSSQLLQNTPLHPIAEWGRQRFGDAETPAAQRLADLENTLKLVGLDPAEHAPLIAPLVDIPLPADRAANLAPEELRRRQLAALIAWFLAGARSQPVALAFEDLHWADPTSLDLMQALAERGHQAPLLILATTRPDFRAPWSLRSHHSVISLSPLDRADVALMVGELAQRRALSQEVVEGVTERTGGVPLFVEEVTRLLLERGETGGLQAIPPTLQQSLAARLDRLGDAREVAQIGAVLGRDFSYALLAAVAAAGLSFPSSAGEGGAERRMGYGPLPRAPVGLHERQPETASSETRSPHPIRPFGPPSPLRGEGGGDGHPALQSALDRLVDADLLFVEGAPPQATYRFKHALIQDAAYESLLKSRRQGLHRRAAEILRDDPERAAAAPEVVAHHFTEAGLDDAAIEWWGKAGDQALRRSAFQEAIAHLGKAIAMADRAAGATAARAAKDDAPSERLKLQIDYGSALGLAKGYAAEETKVALERAAELAATTGDFSNRLVALSDQFGAAATRGVLRLAREVASTLLCEAEERKRIWETGVAHTWLGIIAFWEGDFAAARTYYERALHAHDPNPDPRIWERLGDYKSIGSSYFASVLWQLGDLERAREMVDWGTRRAGEVGNISAIGHALFAKSYLEIWRGDPLATLSTAQALKRVAQEHGMIQFLNEADLHSGWARGRIDDPQG
ncbi:MAG: AAA family ATPase, partial [Hyphomicrobiales bacterium]|nr:AAA family ATPase [Hyphomicrobiales bacterium]